MSITGMNHAVLYVRDSTRHRQFYEDVLDFTTVIDEPGQFAFMRAPRSDNHHDIAFFTIGADAGPSGAGRESVGMYHLAWEVATLGDLILPALPSSFLAPSSTLPAFVLSGTLGSGLGSDPQPNASSPANAIAETLNMALIIPPTAATAATLRIQGLG